MSTYNCTNDSDCSGQPQGVCDIKTRTCFCLIGFTGTTCNELWVDAVPHFNQVLYLYQSIEIVFMLVVIILGLGELFHRWKPKSLKGMEVTTDRCCFVTIKKRDWRHGWRWQWNVAVMAISLCILGAIIRAVNFGIDPHGLRGRLSLSVNYFLYNASIIIFLYAGCAILLFWAEMIHRSGVKEQSNIQKAGPIFIAIMVLIAVTVIPTGIWTGITYTTLSATIYNAILGLFYIGVPILCLIYGILISRKLKNGGATKITQFLFHIVAATVVGTISIILWLFYNTRPWPYLGTYAPTHTAEFWYVISILLLLRTKRVKKEREVKEQDGEGGSIGQASINLAVEESPTEPVSA